MDKGEEDNINLALLLKDLYFTGECLDLTAFILMTICIGYTLTKYRKCNYDKISLIVMIIFWIRYLFRFTIISVSLISQREFNQQNIVDSIFSPITFALAICSLELFIFRIRMKKITLESEDSAVAMLKVERNRKIQNVIIFLTILQGVLIVFFGLNERNQFYLHQTAAKIFILAAIVLKILIDPIVIWISFQVVNFLIERIILTVQD